MSSSRKVEVDLPHPEPCVSYWQQPPDEIADLRSTPELPQDVDIVIVGSGVSGSSIAYNLLSANRKLRIVMLEARQAASGASGRNGGHTKTATYRSFSENVAAVGEDEAIRISQLEYDCMAAVHAFAKEKNIQCDAKRCDTVDIFYDKDHLVEARQSVTLMEKLIGDSHPCSKHTFYSSEDTAKQFYAENSLGCIKYEAGSLSAYKFTIGVLKLALALTLNLQTNTVATSISKSNTDGKTIWTIDTPRGTIKTPTLILATNGYTAHLLPQVKEVIVPFRGVVTAQRPGKSMPHAGNLPTTYSFVYKEGYEYMITRPAIQSSLPPPNGHVSDGPGADTDSAYDIVIGGGLTKTPDLGRSEFHTTDDTFTNIPGSISSYLYDCTADFFGSNWGADHPQRIRHLWSGIMGYSADGHPLVGAYPGEPGLWLDASFQGHGMVLCFLCAKAVTQMILGQDDDKLDEWFPRSFRVTEERLRKKFDGRIVGREIGEAESVNGQSGVIN
ncbi:hypothetical protein LTS08_005783 [Lithohypha guttulata]|nr:hypothetical protein LTS08_005783 [Lithohypha guttulata]